MMKKPSLDNPDASINSFLEAEKTCKDENSICQMDDKSLNPENQQSELEKQESKEPDMPFELKLE
jgi:hypothetical protein